MFTAPVSDERGITIALADPFGGGVAAEERRRAVTLESIELPRAMDRDVARVEDALRRIAAKGNALDRRTADRLAEQVREFAYDVAASAQRSSSDQSP